MMNKTPGGIPVVSVGVLAYEVLRPMGIVLSGLSLLPASSSWPPVGAARVYRQRRFTHRIAQSRLPRGGELPQWATMTIQSRFRRGPLRTHQHDMTEGSTAPDRPAGDPGQPTGSGGGSGGGVLGLIEWIGNKLPDPAFLFLGG